MARKRGQEVCPECGQDLSAVDVFKHIRYHYGERPDELLTTSEAIRRYRQLLRLHENRLQASSEI